jgi:hypothetical protein
MNDLIYNVNAETRTTTCTVQNCKKDFMRMTDKILSQYPEQIRYFYRFITVYYCEKMIKDEYTGRTVCSKFDVFNERYGKDIARTKAIIKRENAFQSTLEAIYNDIETLSEINISIDRSEILDKHLGNFCDLLENEVSLAAMRGYDDEYGIADNIDLNNESTPHCCSLCGATFMNYVDDKEYDSNEQMWKTVGCGDQKLEICHRCMEAISLLSK